jgi:hypothetical protein
LSGLLKNVEEKANSGYFLRRTVYRIQVGTRPCSVKHACSNRDDGVHNKSQSSFTDTSFYLWNEYRRKYRLLAAGWRAFVKPTGIKRSDSLQQPVKLSYIKLFFFSDRLRSSTQLISFRSGNKSVYKLIIYYS